MTKKELLKNLIARRKELRDDIKTGKKDCGPRCFLCERDIGAEREITSFIKQVNRLDEPKNSATLKERE